MRCKMCDIWANPTQAAEEFEPELLRKLPRLNLVNLTGGEPTVRTDLDKIIEILYTKTDRIVVSTSGFLEDRILELAKQFPKLGFRISLEGLSQKNDERRGRPGGFDRGLRTLLRLRAMGTRDVGFGMTVSNHNSADVIHLHELARQLNFEFATATFHNSFYFHKDDNRITNVDEISSNFEELANRLISERHPKAWFRALFNLGLINYAKGRPRMLPCEAGRENFFVDPHGEILPCNGMEKKLWFQSMGNLKDVATFEELWNGPKAEEVRAKVATCSKNCWMIGSASPVMKKYIRQTGTWVLKAKWRSLRGQRLRYADFPHFDVGQDPRQGRIAEIPQYVPIPMVEEASCT